MTQIHGGAPRAIGSMILGCALAGAGVATLGLGWGPHLHVAAEVVSMALIGAGGLVTLIGPQRGYASGSMSPMTNQQWSPDRRVYADDLGQGPQPGEEYAELVGGPLDGLLLEVTWMSERQRADPEGGAYLITDHGAHGPGSRADYAPAPGDPGRWTWRGDVP